MAPKDNRGKVWSDAATRTLIALWSEEAIQISLDTCKTSRQTSKVYQIILVSGSFDIYLIINITRYQVSISELY